MSNDQKGPDNPSPSAGGDPDSQFTKNFEQVIGQYAEATSAGNVQDATAAAIMALQMAEAWALENPTPDLLLKQEADELESKRDWAGAEAVYRKVIALEEATGVFAAIAKAQMDLSRLLRLVGRQEEARQWAVAATASARRADMFPLLYMALENEASGALERDAWPEARTAAEEALRILEPGKLAGTMRAKGQTTLGRCLLDADDSAGAELQLILAWELLAAYASASVWLPGPTSALANWWETKSQLEERRGNLAESLAALRQAVEFRRVLEGPYSLAALAKTLERLGALSRATGDLAGEELVLREAKSIWEGLKLPNHPFPPACD